MATKRTTHIQSDEEYTANKAARLTRLRIRRMGDRELTDFRKSCDRSTGLWVKDFWTGLKAKIRSMDDHQNKKPGGLGRKKAK